MKPNGLRLTPLCLCALATACTPRFDGEASADNRIDDAELLLVAPTALLEAYEPLADWKRARGISTQLVSMEDVAASEAGADEAAQLRARIARGAEEQGTRFVLLGGDYPDIPVRMVDTYVDVDFEGAYYEDSVISELYYADIDGDWDSDGDGMYGQVGDGMDLRAELALGRVPARTAEQVAAYLAKLFTYERWPVPGYQNKALLMGEWAAKVSGIDFYSSTYQEGMMLPLFPEEFEITRMYEDYEEYEGAVENTAENLTA